jgi:5-methylcytosine-specific restriction endonuclease McrA
MDEFWRLMTLCPNCHDTEGVREAIYGMRPAVANTKIDFLLKSRPQIYVNC